MQTQKKNIIFIITQALIIILNLYLNYLFIQNYLTTHLPDSYWLWRLPSFLAILLLVIWTLLLLILKQMIPNSLFLISLTLSLTPSLLFLLLIIGVKHIIINLTQTTRPILMNQSICFGYLLVITLLNIMSVLIYLIALIWQIAKTHAKKQLD